MCALEKRATANGWTSVMRGRYGARKDLTERGRERMREEKEIREALKRLRAPEEDATAGQDLSPMECSYD